MTITPPSVITAYFLLFVSLSWATVQKDASFFDQYYQEINQNIGQGTYQKNIELIDRIIKQQEFTELGCYQKGKIFHKIGVTYYLLNRESEALTYYKDKALESWKDCQEVPLSEKANTIYNIGVSYQYLNDSKSAKPYFDESLNIFENDTLYSRYKLARKYHGVGRFYQSLNDAYRATLYFRNAINLYQETNEKKVHEFEAVNDLIGLTMEFQDYEKAKQYIKEAISIHKSFPEKIPKINLTWVYLNAGTTYLGLKEYKTAEQMAQKALELLDKNEEPFYYSIAIELLAIINADLKDFESAEKYMYEVLEIRKNLGSSLEYQDDIARGYENLCDIFLRKNDIENANKSLKQAFEFLLPNDEFDANHLPIIRKSKILDDRHVIRLIELKTKIFEAQYKESKNLKFLKKVLLAQHKIDSVINRSLFNFQFEQSKLNFLELKFDHYEKAVEDALELYRITDNQFYLQEAYYFSSKTKAIVLQYELNQVNALQSNVSSEVLQKEKELREEMHNQRDLLTEANSQNKDSLLNTFTKAQYALDSYLTEIEKKEPAYIKEKYAFIRPPELKQVQKELPKDMVVIEYFLTENKMYSFWFTNSEFIPITIPYTEDLKNSFGQFIAQCHNPNTAVSKKLSNDIYKALLQEGLDRIGTNIKRICIIPDGALHKLSFEALTVNQNVPQQYLIENYAISYSYALALLFRNHHKKELSNYIGFGSKYSTDLNQKLKVRKRFFGNENLSQLTLSQEEIKRGAAIFDGNTFIDDNATLENFLAYAPKSDIIHLSLHGLVDIDNPDKSCIVFDDRQEEFILSPQDLYSNRLQADLVLLSACHSASGKIYNGEGVQGMSKSFLLGGAHNILSSLWNASEASSMAITTTFLEYIHEGKPIDLALHQSKLDYLSISEPNKRHPYYWANFILLGEIESPKDNVHPLIWMSLAGILILILFFILFSFKKKSIS